MLINSRPANLPDLTVKKLTPSSGVVYPGDDVTFTVEFANIGKADCGPFNIELNGGYNGSLKFRWPGMTAGEAQKAQVGPLHISNLAEYQSVEAVVDRDKEVTESNERNNSKSVVLYYPHPGPFPPGPPGPFPPHLGGH